MTRAEIRDMRVRVASGQVLSQERVYRLLCLVEDALTTAGVDDVEDLEDLEEDDYA